MTPGFYQRAVTESSSAPTVPGRPIVPLYPERLRRFVTRAGAPMKAHALALFTILVWSTTFVATPRSCGPSTQPLSAASPKPATKP